MVFSVFDVWAQNPKMVLVEGGKFKMGSNSEDSYDDEKPVHEVTVNSYWIGKYEVTVAEYKTFCKETKREMPSPPDWGWKDDHPIVNINWQDASAYCEWLTKKTGKQFRLPTEAEWEFAAKGGNLSKHFKYAGSNDPMEVSWHDEQEVGGSTLDEVGTQPVGKLKPNELGIYDMSGNVWEWCNNAYKYYEGNTSEFFLPPGVDRADAMRVLRGGSWYFEVRYSRVTAREGPLASKTDENYGFRVARNE